MVIEISLLFTLNKSARKVRSKLPEMFLQTSMESRSIEKYFQNSRNRSKMMKIVFLDIFVRLSSERNSKIYKFVYTHKHFWESSDGFMKLE